MKLRTLNDNIIVKLPKQEKEQLSLGGIIVSQNSGQAKPDRGIVEEVGDGKVTLTGDMIPLKVKKGDEIIFNRFAGTEIHIENKEETYLIIKEFDILAIIE